MGVCEKSILFIAKEVYIFLTIILPYICIKLWNAKVIILPTEGIYLILYSFLMILWYVFSSTYDEITIFSRAFNDIFNVRKKMTKLFVHIMTLSERCY